MFDLFRFFNEYGTLLHVSRFMPSSEQLWVRTVSGVLVDHFDTEQEARNQEALEIKVGKPVYR